jgi:hypothetical protein
MHSVIRDERIWVTPPGEEGEEKCFARVKYCLSADGAMIAAEEGACSFQGLFPCPWCLAQLGVKGFVGFGTPLGKEDLRLPLQRVAHSRHGVSNNYLVAGGR